MPPNLGGFFMVRSYYPSECHADYFDFERIEALKPAIEACGISTLSQSPMLGFHKQMDNRIKLLDRKSGSAGMPRPISYAVFCLKKKKKKYTFTISAPLFFSTTLSCINIRNTFCYCCVVEFDI